MQKPAKIFRIPETVAMKIAAGEVIENPASVVKELFENSIDAKATSIKVEIEGGGKKSIKVTDDGVGIPSEDLGLSLERFTTSKLKLSDLLLQDIETMGFRGEALASIAAVSRLKMASRTAEEEIASFIMSEAGKILEEGKDARPFGTTVEVKSLFYNFPARRKFLRADATEAKRIEGLLLKLALPFEAREVSLFSEGERTFIFEKGEPLESRIKKLFPKNMVPSLDLEYVAGGYSLKGMITAQGQDLKTSSHIIIYINDRLVRDNTIIHALAQGLRTHISHGRYPAAVIFLKVPPGDIDVNVHPSKAQIKFMDTGLIHNFIERSVKNAIAKGYTPSKSVKSLGPGYPNTYNGPSREPVGDVMSLHEDVMGLAKKGYFANLLVLGQLKKSYIICGDDKGVVIIDQHAAHERVAFENLMEEFSKNTVSVQKLLFPIEFELKGEKALILKDNLQRFEALGFLIEGFGKNSFMIRGVPEMLSDTDHIRTIDDILEMMSEYSQKAQDEMTEEIIKSMACRSSVRFSKSLSKEEINSLLDQLDGLKDALTCPHGRPFMVSLDEGELKKLFKRT